MEDGGLKSFKIYSLYDKGKLEVEPLQMLVEKAATCHTLTLSDLEDTSEINRATLLDFARQVCAITPCLKFLTLSTTNTDIESGIAFMQVLAGNEAITSLE